MQKNIGLSLKLLFGDEGGYSNRVTDAGGPTKYGITQRTLAAHRGHPVRIEDVQNLTLAEAGEIYQKGYWAQAGGNILPSGLDYAVFNSAVMSGPARAVKILQEVLDVTPDGSIGPITQAAVKRYEDRGALKVLIGKYINAYMAFLRNIKNPKTGFPVNGRGWTYRILGEDPLGKFSRKPGVLGHALQMVDGAKPEPTEFPTAAPEGDSKAVADKPSILKDPATIGTGLGMVLTPAFASTSGFVQVALGVGLILTFLLIGYFVFRKISAMQV